MEDLLAWITTFRHGYTGTDRGSIWCGNRQGRQSKEWMPSGVGEHNQGKEPEQVNLAFTVSIVPEAASRRPLSQSVPAWGASKRSRSR